MGSAGISVANLALREFCKTKRFILLFNNISQVKQQRYERMLCIRSN